MIFLLPLRLMSQRSSDEVDEEGMRVFRSALEFRMKLNSDEERVRGKFHDLDKAAGRVYAAE